MSGFRVLVHGAGGHGKVVADVALCAGWDVCGFVDDSPAKKGQQVLGLPIWSPGDVPAQLRSAHLVLGIGDNATRANAVERLRAGGGSVAPALVHPAATVGRGAQVGAGTVVMAHVVVNPDATVGEGCILNSACVIEHNCVVGAFAHVSPNAALGGAVRIGARVHVGLGAAVLPGVYIGEGARVGAGAVVVRDVAPGVTVVGVPARPVARREEDRR